jgi:hypothetical protein
MRLPLIAWFLVAASCGGNSIGEQDYGAPGNSGSGGSAGGDGGIACVQMDGSGAACAAPDVYFYCPKSETPPPQCTSCDWAPGSLHYTCIPPPELAPSALGCMRCCCPL